MTNAAPSFRVGDGETPDYTGNDDYRNPRMADIAVAPDGTIGILTNAVNVDPDSLIRLINPVGGLIGGSNVSGPDYGSNSATTIVAQSDGKFLVASVYGNCSTEPCSYWRIYRINADGSRDRDFANGRGYVEQFGSAGDNIPKNIVVLDDDSFVVGGLADGPYGFVEYDSEGNQQQINRLLSSSDMPISSDPDMRDMSLFPDGKILVAVKLTTGWSVIRLTETLDRDLTFAGGNGKLAMDIGAINFIGHSMALRSDSGFVMVGEIGGDFALVAHNSDGSIDTSFGGGDGIVITPVGTIGDSARAVFIDDDDTITVTGFKYDPNIGRHDFVVTRYDGNGVLDTTYGNNGVAHTPNFGLGKVAIQADGSILVTGDRMSVLRLDPSGDRDNPFGGDYTLGDTVSFTENGVAIHLDMGVQIFDKELSAANGGDGNFDGASLTLERSAGSEPQDFFGFQFTPESALMLNGLAIEVGGMVIADIAQTGGQLRIVFTDANGAIPDSAFVDEVMQAITYANTADTPVSAVDLEWTFDDGNQGAQGSGGAKTTTGTTHVNINAVNDAPVISDDLSGTLVTEGWIDTEILIGTFTATDPETDVFDFSVNDARFTINITSTAGHFELAVRAGSNIDFEQASSIDVQVTATETATAELLSGSRTFTIEVNDVAREIFDASAAVEDLTMIAYGPEDMNLMGGTRNDSLVADTGDDSLNGGGGNDTLRAGKGQDTIVGGAGADRIVIGAGQDMGQETYDGGTGYDTLLLAGGSDNVVHDLRSHIISGVEEIEFGSLSEGSRTVIATAVQIQNFGSSGLIDGDSNDEVAERLQIHLESLSTFVLPSYVSFVGWNMTSDLVELIAGASNSTIIGSAFKDVIRGNSGKDALFGGGAADLILGSAGNDTLRGDGGNDTLDGGTGADELIGGAGSDSASYASATLSLSLDLRSGTFGGAAVGDTFSSIENIVGTNFNDYIYGDNGQNLLIGGEGDDQLRGHNGHDTLVGGTGADDLNGGSGIDFASYADASDRVNLDLRSRGTFGDAANDTFTSIENVTGTDYDDYIYGDVANNAIYGGKGNDRIRGDEGNDILRGNDGDDDLHGGFDNDSLYGDAGNDTLRGRSGADALLGGAGIDTASYSGAAQRVNLDLRSQGTSGDALGDTFLSIENVITSQFDDYVYGDDKDNVIDGGDGFDRLRGHNGNDTLIGGAGADDLHGGGGIDTASYETAQSHVNLDLRSRGTSGDALNDTFHAIENVMASQFDDYVYGDNGQNLLNGSDGDDRLRGHNGHDTLIGGTGADDLNGGSGVDVASYAGAAGRVNLDLRSRGTFGDASNDTFTSIENVIGTDYNDYLYGDAEDNILFGGGGDDRLRGDDGNDTVVGDAGTDELRGGSGADLFVFNRGSETDVIKDYQDDVDIIELDRTLIASGNSAFSYATQIGADVQFDFDAQDLLLVENATLAQLQDDVTVV
ncbi:hypothetical protein [Falsiruegeria litorea]|uniref:Ca2+-binding protein, RTX toxin-related n=1 Tax=Falsiruegeria litorea TaxID=1280831 RepID=A0ABS5WMG3_9RHOB|nr:hypothetical protein [Falsiruegeria litorea]MBT3140317.1 hypothetical protein [Falsiruegeria litorea]MBT8171047.1 hypothetical protein [Falsiruegeria litorea]